MIFNITRIGCIFALFRKLKKNSKKLKLTETEKLRCVRAPPHGYCIKKKRHKNQNKKTTTGSILELTSGTVEFFCAFLARRRALALSYHSPAVFPRPLSSTHLVHQLQLSLTVTSLQLYSFGQNHHEHTVIGRFEGLSPFPELCWCL